MIISWQTVLNLLLVGLLCVIWLRRKVLTVVVSALLVHLGHLAGIHYKDNKQKPATNAKSTKKTVAVIGSGPSGVAAAKCLLDEGHDVVVFEKAACVGGNWYYCQHPCLICTHHFHL